MYDLGDNLFCKISCSLPRHRNNSPPFLLSAAFFLCDSSPVISRASLSDRQSFTIRATNTIQRLGLSFLIVTVFRLLGRLIFF